MPAPIDQKHTAITSSYPLDRAEEPEAIDQGEDRVEAEPAAVAHDMDVDQDLLVHVAQDVEGDDGTNNLVDSIVAYLALRLPSMADTKLNASMAVYGTLGGLAGGPVGAVLGVSVGAALARGQAQLLDHDPRRIAMTHLGTLAGAVGVALSAPHAKDEPGIALAFAGGTLVMDGLATVAGKQFQF